jgi:moderate conductance mechanosensitive channel
LTITGSSNDARGTVEDVTLRVTKLRTSDGEVYTVPNGQIVKLLNLSKDWARAVVDVPALLLDQPAVMGVESIGVDEIKVRMVARTLPGKQFHVGRRLRVLVVGALGRAGIHGGATVEAS